MNYFDGEKIKLFKGIGELNLGMNYDKVIQLMMAMSCCVNGGNLLKPYVLKSVVDETQTEVYTSKVCKKRNVISQNTSELMRYALETVVSFGSGRNSYVNGYRIGGKTGVLSC